MKANLRQSLLFLSSVCFVLGLAPQLAGAGAPVGQTGAAAQGGSSGETKIEVENWAKPESGWLYVLDPTPEAGGSGGHVWLLDPATVKVMGSIRTGDNADFALSPDGTRLYVASVKDADSSELAVIDTVQGVVLKSGVVGGRAVSNGLPPFSTMAVSGDGLALRILIDAPKSPDADSQIGRAHV